MSATRAYSRRCRIQHIDSEGLLGAGGVRARPHKPCHVAITEALELTGGDCELCSGFPAPGPAGLDEYDDSRLDLTWEITRMVVVGRRPCFAGWPG